MTEVVREGVRKLETCVDKMSNSDTADPPDLRRLGLRQCPHALEERQSLDQLHHTSLDVDMDCIPPFVALPKNDMRSRAMHYLIEVSKPRRENSLCVTCTFPVTKNLNGDDSVEHKVTHYL